MLYQVGNIFPSFEFLCILARGYWRNIAWAGCYRCVTSRLQLDKLKLPTTKAHGLVHVERDTCLCRSAQVRASLVSRPLCIRTADRGRRPFTPRLDTSTGDDRVHDDHLRHQKSALESFMNENTVNRARQTTPKGVSTKQPK